MKGFKWGSGLHGKDLTSYRVENGGRGQKDTKGQHLERNCYINHSKTGSLAEIVNTSIK